MMKSIPNQKSGTVDRLDISSATRWSGLFGQEAAGWWLDKQTNIRTPSQPGTSPGFTNPQERTKNAQKTQENRLFLKQKRISRCFLRRRKNAESFKNRLFLKQKRDFIDLQSPNFPAALRAGGGKFSNLSDIWNDSKWFGKRKTRSIRWR